MKIGILTYHRSHNYGAVLQAIATRIVLQDMGHAVYYVDYWPKYHQRLYKIFNINAFKKLGLKGKLEYIRLVLTKYSKKKERIANFESFINVYISPYCKPTTEEFDIIIIGSDQVWRFQKQLQGYNKIYFGDNDFKAQRQVTYAASMGIIPTTDTDKERIRGLIHHLDRISVREYDLHQLVEELGCHAEMHLDPTLLLDKEKWNNVFPPTQYNGAPYVLYYNMLGGAFEEKKIRAFAVKHGLEVKSIVGNIRQYPTQGEQETAGPEEFINLIRNAQFIFTTSFHGLAFSLIFNKQFYASYSRNAGRAASLLHTLGLDTRLLEPNSDIPLDATPIEYCSVNSLMHTLRKSSLNYLSEVSQ